MRRDLHFSLLLSLLLGLSACQSGKPASEPSPYKPLASLQEVMNSIVDPAADRRWESVGTELTKEGPVEHQPKNDEEWAAVRRDALLLVEAANLLRIPARPVVAQGAKVEDAHVAGVLSAEQIQSAVTQDRAAFLAAADKLQTVAAAALAAVDSRSVPGLLKAGGELQDACESCHVRFWYPNARKPPSQ